MGLFTSHCSVFFCLYPTYGNYLFSRDANDYIHRAPCTYVYCDRNPSLFHAYTSAVKNTDSGALCYTNPGRCLYCHAHSCAC